jgi:hypothetical protein
MNINPELKIGDEIVLYSMLDETMSPGTKGIVSSIFTFGGEKIYGVDWEDGRSLNLLSDVDFWQKIEKNIRESEMNKLIGSNLELSNFDLSFVVDFLNDLRESSVVNMFGASHYLYMGRERIEHEFKYREFIDEESEEAFERVLEKANEMQSKVIDGVMKIMEKNKKELDIDVINSNIRKYSSKLLMFYIALKSTN